MRTIAATLLAASAFAADLYFPPARGEWSRVEPASVGWNGAALDAVLDYAKQRKSSAVVILHNGRILAEQRWDPPPASARYTARKAADGQVLEDVASVQKSVTATLFGIALHKGLVRLEDPVSKHLGEGWSKAAREQEAKITMRHLLTMTSGLSDELTYQSEPGARWRYNSPAYQKTVRALAKAAGKSENEITREWLTGRIGMTHSLWRDRERSSGLLGFISTARDLARFGLLIQNNGDWAGESVVEDKAYLREMLSPSQDRNRAYGYLWWLNGHPVARGNGVAPTLIESAPSDLVAALGAMQRKIYVVRSLGLVVTRTGDDPGEQGFDAAFWRLLMKAAPRKAQ